MMTIELTTDELKVMEEGTERFGAFAMAAKTTTGEPVFLRVQGPQRRRRNARANGPEVKETAAAPLLEQ